MKNRKGKKIFLVDTKVLRPHERISIFKAWLVFVKIVISQRIEQPILVDKKYKVVLDGHHRLWAAKKIGLIKIPCELVDYLKDDSIKVYKRRSRIHINKLMVVNYAINGLFFPAKTTRHEKVNLS